MTTILFTNQRIEEGAELVARLREIIPITAAFWVGDTDKFIIASPAVDERGRIAFYMELDRRATKANLLVDVYGVSPNDPVAAQLAALGSFKSGPFKAYLDGCCPSYIEEGADWVTGYAYGLDTLATRPNSKAIPPASPSPPRNGKPPSGPLESVTHGRNQ